VWEPARRALALFAPLLLGFAVHGVCIRLGLLRALGRPIDGGRRWRGRRLFGENKTFRGVVAVAAGTGVGYAISSAAGVWPAGPLSHPEMAVAVGLLAGAAAMAAELPNSLLKRQLGIAPGSQPGGMLGPLFHVLDQVDVVAGAWAVLLWVVEPDLGTVLASLVFMYVAHQAVTLAGYVLGMRATWR
jgi:CDP-2,3-bis-(O-geranylgeranyl)-sn-glycerol synthase